MNLQATGAIAKAVLYEGFILYPYRSSSVKNQQRWTFGSIYPRAYAEQVGGDACRQQVQCLVQGDAHAQLELRVRFLHLVERQVGRVEPGQHDIPRGGESFGQPSGKPSGEPFGEPIFTPLACLAVGGRNYYAWQEAEERELTLPVAALGELCAAPRSMPFDIAAARMLEPIHDSTGVLAGVLVRTRQRLAATVTASAERLRENLFRITVATENETPFDAALVRGRDAAAVYALASTHAVLGVRGGAFASLIDPPEDCRQEAEACVNLGAFPVLVGQEGVRDTLLASPIILYDYPQIAPESPGDLFDGTEIDEILTLRILAMTDQEKQEMRAVDAHARQLLERTEALTGEQLRNLHGAMRPIAADRDGGGPAAHPAEPYGAAPGCKVGDRVRLHPGNGSHGPGDIMDIVLDGKTAVIEAIETDFEGRVHVAVAVDDDPGRDMGLARMPGHRFFFSLAEIALLEDV